MFFEWLGTSCFSFLEGTTQPNELVDACVDRGYAGLGLADRMGLYGLARGFHAAREARERRPDFSFAVGIRLHFDVADPLFVYPCHRRAYSDLCRFLSSWALEGMPLREKGLTPLRWRDFLGFLRQRTDLSRDFVLISVGGRFFPWISNPDLEEESRVRTQDAVAPTPSFSTPPKQGNQCPFWLLELAEVCGRGAESALSLAFPLTFAPGVAELQEWLVERARDLRLPLLATTLPLFVDREDFELSQLMAAIRHAKPLDELGYLSQANSERRLLGPDDLRRLKLVLAARLQASGGPPLAIDPFERGLQLKERLHFSLEELRYRYPKESVPAGETASSWLRKLAYEKLLEFPPEKQAALRKQVDHELELIAKLGYEDYFLTIWDVLKYARDQNILFQGRGSAANSAVCYVLGITAIDPVQMDLLFERFLSMERAEPPDIDIDFEHERREEVLQEVYRRYGRHRAAMVSSVIRFRGRMAIRETAKALGFPKEAIDAVVNYMGREGFERIAGAVDPPEDLKTRLRAHKIGRQRWARLLRLVPLLRGLPRHMGLHTGGFVLSDDPLVDLCVLEPARMENRSIVPWDKDDIDALGWMKVDFLSLGMLSCLRKCFDFVGDRNFSGKRLGLAEIPHDDPAVYRSLQRADTVGVFQIESRAQMNMLPRLRPRNFYDIVIEVAIVRPGPLQGGMVHPYLRRRQGLEAPSYAHPKLEPILKKTLGVAIFQEQVMKMAVAVGGFTPGEADQLRKVMSGAWRSSSRMYKLRDKLMQGMRSNGISEDYCERIYRQIEGFGEYGFPESHSASFSLLTYASAWMKEHYPAEFLCALLNSLPMGFYAPRALVGDAERHGVVVRRPHVLYSGWDSTLERDWNEAKPAVRLGLRLIEGFPEREARLLERLARTGFLARDRRPSFEDLRLQGLSQRGLETLIRAGALAPPAEVSAPNAFPSARREQVWEALPLRKLGHVREGETQGQARLALRGAISTPIPRASDWEKLLNDYRELGLSPGRHPIPLLRVSFGAPRPRPGLAAPEKTWTTAEAVYLARDRSRLTILGLLSVKQKPPTAGGMCFLTLEDETGFFNLALRPTEYERFRLLIQEGSLLASTVRLQKSAPSDPQDPRTSAASLLVETLWNPLVGGQGPSTRAEDEKAFQRGSRNFF